MTSRGCKPEFAEAFGFEPARQAVPQRLTALFAAGAARMPVGTLGEAGEDMPLVELRHVGEGWRGLLAHAGAFTPLSASIFENSPLAAISRTMSQPPTNSPFT